METTVQSIISFLEARSSDSPLSAAQLNNLVSDLKSQINQLSASVENAAADAITVLYSGSMPDGTHTSEVAKALSASNPSKFLIIDQTEVGDLLSRQEFKDALLSAVGNDNATLQKILDGSTVNGERVPDGLWDDASRRFAQNASGDVRVIAPNGDISRVFGQTELPALLANPAVTHIEGIPKAQLAALAQSKGLAAVGELLFDYSLISTKLTGLAAGNYSAYLQFNPEILGTYFDDPAKVKLFEELADSIGAERLARVQTSMGNAVDVSHTLHAGGLSKALNKLGLIGGLFGFMLAANEAAAAGSDEQAKEIMKLWAVDAAGSEIAAIVGTALGGLAVGVAAAVGVTIGAPLAGAIIFGAGIAGALFGGDAATELYHLMDDRDANGRRDVIDKLSNLLFGATATITTPPVADLNGARYTIDAALTRDEIIAQAKNDIAWRYALRELNPFVITDIDYSAHNSDGSLDLYDPVTGTGSMTEDFLQDRAAMLTWKLRYDNGERDEDDGTHAGVKPYNEDWDTSLVRGNWDFIDHTHKLPGGAPLQLSIDGTGISLHDHQIVFGSKNGESIEGAGDSDSLYGMAGDDALNGKDGQDYLEGGIGNDTLIGGKGVDSLVGGKGADEYRFAAGEGGGDVIIDADGVGSIWLDGVQLTGGKQLGTNQVWQSDDKRFTYTLETQADGSKNLLIAGPDGFSTTIKKYTSGQLGLQLNGAETSSPPFAATQLNGEFVSLIYDIQPSQSEYPPVPLNWALVHYGGYSVFTWNSYEKDKKFSFSFGPSNDVIFSGAVSDPLQVASETASGRGAAMSDDLVRQGDIPDEYANIGLNAGDDIWVGGDRNDTVVGEAGADLIVGGGGSDMLWGGAPMAWDVKPDFRNWTHTYQLEHAGQTYEFSRKTYSPYGAPANRYSMLNGYSDGTAHFRMLNVEIGSDPLPWPFNKAFETYDTGDDTFDQNAVWDIDNTLGGPILTGDSQSLGTFNVYFPWVYHELDYPPGYAYHSYTLYSLNDPIWDDGANDTIYAGGGGDFALGGKGSDYIQGDDGDDILAGGVGNDTVLGGNHNDTIWGGAPFLGTADDGKDLLDGGDGDDWIMGGSSADRIFGGAGADWIAGDQPRYFVGQTVSADKAGDDVVFAGAGNDTVYGQGGADFIDGGDGDDSLDGDADSAVISDTSMIAAVTAAMQQDDTIFGGNGNDQLTGGGGRDWLSGDDGRDTLFGGDGDDTLLGGAGIDQLVGGKGQDVLVGGDGADSLWGDDGNDDISGGDGNDSLVGGEGSDSLFGDAGNDHLEASAGDDLLDGGAGNDTLVGGDGGDIFIIGPGDVVFDTAGANRVLLNAPPTAIHVVAGGRWLVLEFAGEASSYVQVSSALQLDRGKGLESIADILAELANQGAENGSAWENSLPGTYGDDTLLGDGSTNFMVGGLGTDVINGGDGDDILLGGDDLDKLDGDAGDDYVGGGWGNDILSGGGGNDTVDGGIGHDTLHGDDGNDSLSGELQDDRLFGDAGQDTLAGGDGNDTLSGGAGEDFLNGMSGNDLLWGDSGSDIYHFSRGFGSDVIVEQVEASHGDGDINVVRFAPDISDGEVIVKRDGDDLIVSLVNSSDSLRITAFFAVPVAGASYLPQTILLEFSNGLQFDVAQMLTGNPLSQDWTGSAEADAFNGMGGNDSLRGLGGHDVLSGGDGNDKVWAGDGDDDLSGDEGDDFLDGGSGADSLSGGTGNDTYIGGSGSDVYVFGRNLGSDVVYMSYDDAPADVDTIEFDASVAQGDVSALRAGDDLVISISGNTGTLVLKGYFDAETSGGNYMVEAIRFENGTVLDHNGIKALWWKPGMGTGNGDVLTGTAGDDTLIGFGGGDSLVGGDGNDELDGGDGRDTLRGGSGDDVLIGGPSTENSGAQLLDGGLGVDTMIGSAGLDTYVVDNVSDVIQSGTTMDDPLLFNWTYSDLVQTSISYVLPNGFRKLTLTGSSPINGTGSQTLDNVLTGNSGANILTGGDGQDTLNGGGGADILIGGAGGDYYYVDNPGDVIVESADEFGFDDVEASTSYILPPGVEGLWLTGESPFALSGTGNSSSNFIVGNYLANSLKGMAGSDELWGEAGKDTLDGGLGDDWLNGGDGSDTYLFGIDAGQDVIDQYDVSSGHVDTVLLGSGVTPAMLMLSRDGDDLVMNITGATDSLRVRNHFADDAAYRINQIKFADNTTWNEATITAKGNNHLPVVANALPDAALVAELNWNWTIPADSFVDPDVGDSLSLSSSLADGSPLPAWLNFNAATRTFSGMPPAGSSGVIEILVKATDPLGLSVTDSLALHVLAPIVGTAGDDNLVGSAADDYLKGLAGKDTLLGGEGEDTLAGGVGDDVYLLMDAADVVIELSGEGEDVAVSWSSYTLPENMESLVLASGSEALEATGNALSNQLVGNELSNLLFGLAGADMLDGGDGNDTLAGGEGIDLLIGGAGDDLYVLPDGQDAIVEYAGGGNDSVVSWIDYALPEYIEGVTLAEGSSATYVAGNAAGNVIVGNSLDNYLDGRDGDDLLEGGDGADALLGGGGLNTLVGGAGDDVYVISSAADEIVELAGGGTDVVVSWASFVLPEHVDILMLAEGSSATHAFGQGQSNILVGNALDNLLEGRGGDDSLKGGLGNDTYVFGRSDGNDTISEDDSTVAQADVLQFTGDIDATQLWFTQSGYDLEVSVIGSADKTIIQNWYLGAQYQVEQFKSGDGKTLLDSQVANLVNAMAAFAPPSAGQTTLPANYQSALNSVIAANWQ